MLIKLIIAAFLSGLTCSAIATFRNRSLVGWFILGTLSLLIALVAICAIEPLDTEGKPLARCCRHCPAREPQ